MNNNESKKEAVKTASEGVGGLKKEMELSSWHEGASCVCCLNSYPNGITFSIHTAEQAGRGQESINRFGLRLRDTRSYQLPVGKYFLYKKDIRANLEKHLWALRKKGKLEDAVIYFGTIADPFSAFHRRFDNTIACLELLEKYLPLRVVIQTRSPMLIAALPILKKYGDRAIANMYIETPKETCIMRYTPGQPSVSQRLLAIQGVRTQGVKVAITAGPILPYGDFNRDAWDFAELIDRYSDYVSVSALATDAAEKSLRNMELTTKLDADKQYKLLRPEAYKPLLMALTSICPEKLVLPSLVRPSQMDLFAA